MQKHIEGFIADQSHLKELAMPINVVANGPNVQTEIEGIKRQQNSPASTASK